MNEAGLAGLSLLSRQQWRALATLVCIMLIDGFDLVALGLVAVHVSAEWSVSPSMLGLALSSAQFGAIVGAAVIGRLNERYSERSLLIGVGMVLGFGSIICALSTGIWGLMLGRAVTGIGLGAVWALVVGFISGRLPHQVRGTVLSIALVGLGAGQVLAGASAAALISAVGWRSMFGVGAALSILLLPFLIALPRSRAISRNDGANSATSIAKRNGRISALWRVGWHVQLVLLPMVVMTSALIAYFLLTWLPFLAARSGLSAAASAACTSLLVGGGLIGGLVSGGLMDRGASPFVVLSAAFALSATLLLGIATLPLSPSGTLFICGLIGFFLMGAYNTISVLIASVFPQEAHVNVMGLVTIAARLGGLVAPAVAGFLLAADMESHSLFSIAALLAVAVALGLAVGGRVRRATEAVTYQGEAQVQSVPPPPRP